MTRNDSFNIEDSKIVRKRILEILEPYSKNTPFMITSLMAIIADICEHLEVSGEDFKEILKGFAQGYEAVINEEVKHE